MKIKYVEMFHRNISHTYTFSYIAHITKPTPRVLASTEPRDRFLIHLMLYTDTWASHHMSESD